VVGRAIVVLAAACLLQVAASSSILPPRYGDLRIHSRNLSGQLMAMETQSLSGWGYSVMGPGGGGGCEATSVPWTISVGTVAPNDLEGGDYQPILDSSDFGDADSVELWVEVTAAGDIRTGQGHPAWSESWPGHCGRFTGQ
jgi:hypothetical protein